MAAVEFRIRVTNRRNQDLLSPMGMDNTPEKPLLCPDCETRLVWDGGQYCCTACPWTEHRAKPPSTSKIIVPKKPGDASQENPDNSKT